MAQTGLGLFAGDMISNFILRMGGTAVGLVLGIVAWYVGSGRGNGNPYGLTVISVSFLFHSPNNSFSSSKDKGEKTTV